MQHADERMGVAQLLADEGAERKRIAQCFGQPAGADDAGEFRALIGILRGCIAAAAPRVEAARQLGQMAPQTA